MRAGGSFSTDCQQSLAVDIVSAMASLGKTLILTGLLLAVCGVGLWAIGNFNLPMPLAGRIGRLPGDVYIKRGNFTFYFPLMTSIVVSLVLTVLFALLRR